MHAATYRLDWNLAWKRFSKPAETVRMVRRAVASKLITWSGAGGGGSISHVCNDNSTEPPAFGHTVAAKLRMALMVVTSNAISATTPTSRAAAMRAGKKNAAGFSRFTKERTICHARITTKACLVRHTQTPQPTV